jgi:hypothetical protein
MLNSPRLKAFAREKKLSIITERISLKVVQEEHPELLVLYQSRSPSLSMERQDEPFKSRT